MRWTINRTTERAAVSVIPSPRAHRVKPWLSRLGFMALIVICGCVGLCAQEPNLEGQKQMERQKRSGIFTLYVLDPLARALCFRDGRAGLMFQSNRLTNRCSDLSFNLAAGGSFTTGIEANRMGAIVDLGTADELRQRYGYEDADGGGEGFASLRLQGDKILILKEDRPQERLQPVREAPALFSEVKPSANAPVKLGHIYLVRIIDAKDTNSQIIVKLMVIAYTPNETVTVRWELL